MTGVKIAVFAGVIALTSTSAMADAVVCLNCYDEPTAVLNAAAVAANWVTQLERMTAQIQEQILIFQQLSGLTNVNAMAGVLNQAGNFNQMNSFGNVPAMLQGAGGGIGAAYQAANANVLPVGSTIPIVNVTNTVFNDRAASLASIQGISGALLVNANVILNGLRTLQQLIDQQPSSQLMGGMNARLAAYQGNINSQQYQLSQMQAFANAQDKVFEQKVQQAGYCADLDLVNSTQSLTSAGRMLGQPIVLSAVALLLCRLLAPRQPLAPIREASTRRCLCHPSRRLLRSRRTNMRTSLIALFLLAAPLAHADPAWAIRPEPGLVCMTTSHSVPIQEKPRADALALATAGPIVFIITPQHVEAGYVEVERPNRQIGWIQQDALSAGPTKCVPTLMSNGLILTAGAR